VAQWHCDNAVLKIAKSHHEQSDLGSPGGCMPVGCGISVSLIIDRFSFQSSV
jgi:hypothetical protein